MSAARTVAQAKINLFLHVLGRETSGYHALETLFQRVELGDDVTVRTGVQGRSLDCRGADTGPVERNLAWRAAEAFTAAAGWPSGFAIEIDKRIPVGAGLGGGSADAGAVLRLLNALAPTPLDAHALLSLAIGLGADVPFLAGQAARALGWGRGERLLALPPLPSREVALLLPPASVATADAFRWLAASREAAGALEPRARQLDLAALDSWSNLVPLAGNDFEAVVAGQVREVAVMVDARGFFAPPLPPEIVRPIYEMSGSGSAWFLLLADDRVRLELEDSDDWRVVWTQTAERAAAVERLD